MGRTERAEYTVGVVALLAGIAVLGFSALANRVQTGGDSSAVHYFAQFKRADGLHVGAPVRLAGIDVGQVRDLNLDEHFNAVATLVLSRDVPLPDDSAAIIETDGIFGSKYVELQPGGSLDNLPRGGRIGYTQDSVIIEDLISKIVQQAKASMAKTKDADSGSAGNDEQMDSSQ
ncbi:MAG: MCE family protein [Rhodobacteraceae bacterium]|nr:MCE family protein [Paracoccaceae bacterium]